MENISFYYLHNKHEIIDSEFSFFLQKNKIKINFKYLILIKIT